MAWQFIDSSSREKVSAKPEKQPAQDCITGRFG